LEARTNGTFWYARWVGKAVDPKSTTTLHPGEIWPTALRPGEIWPRWMVLWLMGQNPIVPSKLKQLIRSRTSAVKISMVAQKPAIVNACHRHPDLLHGTVLRYRFELSILLVLIFVRVTGTRACWQRTLQPHLSPASVGFVQCFLDPAVAQSPENYR
jgi:hypothetical protein